MHRYIPRWQPHKKKSQDTWPTEDDFNQYSEVMRWRDLQKGIYKILGYRETRNNYGIALILQLRRRDSENVVGHLKD